MKASRRRPIKITEILEDDADNSKNAQPIMDIEPRLDQAKSFEDIKIIDKITNLQIDEKALLRKFFENETPEMIQKLLIFHDNYMENLTKKPQKISSKWELIKIEFSNLLIFGPDNIIDFTKFPKNEIIGLFAPNSYGKSSIIDIIIFALYGKITRFIGKGYCRDLININEASYYCMIEFMIEGSKYTIIRSGEPAKSPEKINHTLEFYINDMKHKEGKKSLEETISTLIGTHEDFILTNVLLQKGNKSFKDLPQRERKDLLNSILQMEKFERILASIKDDIKKLKAKKELIEENLHGLTENEIQCNIRDLETCAKDLITQKKKKSKKMEKTETKIREICADHQIYANEIPEEIEQLDVDTTKRMINISKERLVVLEQDIQKLDLIKHESEIVKEFYKIESESTIKINEYDNRIKMIENKFSKQVLQTIKLNTIDYFKNLKEKAAEELSIKKKEVLKLKKQIDDNIKLIDKYKNVDEHYYAIIQAESDIEALQERQDKYINVEYDPNCKYCMKNPLNLELKDIRKKCKEKEDFIKATENLYYPENTKGIFQKRKEYMSSMLGLNEKLKQEQEALLKLQDTFDTHDMFYEDKREYMDYDEELVNLRANRDDLIRKREGQVSAKRYRELQKQKEILEGKNKEIERVKTELDYNTKRINYLELHGLIKKKAKYKKEFDELNDQIGANKNQHLNLENLLKRNAIDRKNYDEILDDINLHEKYSTAVHKNGIPLMIMSTYLPLIQDRINSLIQDFVNFEIILENNGDSIDLYISKRLSSLAHDRPNRRNIYSIYGGMESFIIDLGFKIAIAEIARIPKCNIIFIDEGLSVLDKTKIAHINKLFAFLKRHFDRAVIISHNEVVEKFINHKMTILKDAKVDISKIYEVKNACV